jgi:L-methionine (R)-S-oxide reductase
MHEIEVTTAPSKQEQYTSLIPQIEALCSGEKDLIANLSNIASALKQQFNWWWIGFYLVKKNELVLGPFQGPVACTRIAFGKGVCGTSWQKNETILVEDVEQFPGHIACSHASKSEIVVPIYKHDNIVAVLDADSEHLSHFNATDQQYLEQLAVFISTLF